MVKTLDNLTMAELQARVVQLTEQLMQSEKLASIGQLAAGVAHEINNPVGYIMANMKVLADYSNSLISLVEAMHPGMSAEQHQALKQQLDFDYVCEDLPRLVQESEQGLKRVVEIIRALKDFSYLEEAEFVCADLHEGIQSTLKIVASELKYKAELITDFSVIPCVFCIPSQLNQILLNLLVNAAHAIEKYGQIWIRTGCDERWVWFSVADSGTGISADKLKRIFEPFYTTKPKGQGTGLGLALSQSIVEKHKGKIDVQSTPGEGSCFTIKIPRNLPD
jgi:two-component system, NtrC family, sensor kinase